MAIIKFKWGKSPKQIINYAIKDRSDGDLLHTEGCSAETAEQDFANIKKLHHKERGNQTFMLIQSWSPEDSVIRSPVEFHQMGKKLVETLFPDHQYIIKTHTDKAHTHNHIIINTVNSKTGSRIENKYFWPNSDQRFKDKIYSVNDQVCREN